MSSHWILTMKRNKYIWKSTQVYTAFLFMGHAFWKENFENRVKLLESNVLNWCLRITMADLCKVGLKVREWRFRELSPKFPNEGGAMSLTPGKRASPFAAVNKQRNFTNKQTSCSWNKQRRWQSSVLKF